MPEAMRLFLHQCINDQALPFRPHLNCPKSPNDETAATMEEGNRMIKGEQAGTLSAPTFKTAEELFADLES